ncbi:MAG: hypothetical protein WEC79_07240, partial [Thermomicrobiales bacterium]
MSRFGTRRMLAVAASALVVFQFLSLGLAGWSFGNGDAALANAPGNDAFQSVWARTDKPVFDGLAIRSWLWGPVANSGVLREPYAESPDGMRDVQYFDKSRMEITHPEALNDGVWYVTNGLLVNELVSGAMQTGDARFEEGEPASVNVAGDPDDTSGPTYATFGPLRAYGPLPDGGIVTQRLSR